MRSKVALIRCPDYEPGMVEEKLREGLAWLGGVRRFFHPGQTVLVKPNLLSATPPERAVTTHPAVVRGVIRLIQEAGARVVVGDSPGYGHPTRVAEKAGVLEVCRETGAEFVPFQEVREKVFREGKVVKRLPLALPVLEADAVVSVAKLKTHGLTTYTGAVKNLFGCVVGFNKPQLHLRLQRRQEFGGMLVDLYQAVRPVLSVVDGIVAMEGEGPSHGRPRKMEAILMGEDGLAVDVVAAGLIGLKPEQVLYLEAAIRQGIIPPGDDWVEVVGSPPTDLRVTDFALPASQQQPVPGFPRPLVRLLARQLTPRPQIRAEVCRGCGVCQQSCPPQAITIHQGRAVIDEAQCIRCYCCQELCPYGAVVLRRQGLGRFLASR